VSAVVIVLAIVLAAAALAASLLLWNARQRDGLEVPQRRHRDLDVRIDHVVSGAHDVADRAVRLAASTDAESIEPGWRTVRSDMLAIEGDIVNLDAHVGEAPVGRSLADLDRAVYALRDAVERHIELRAAEPADDHALGLSKEVVDERRREVGIALEQVGATRP